MPDEFDLVINHLAFFFIYLNKIKIQIQQSAILAVINVMLSLITGFLKKSRRNRIIVKDSGRRNQTIAKSK